ncbi:MAG: isopentenyl-diphosphate Delta-isomerase [Chthonomonas sp.]|nr:isopentenyl-diphosphate Delta-isomerase [Chthonomonas sp.]
MNEELVQIVDDNGQTIGSMEKLAAHEHGGTLHRAVSVLLFNSRGELLIQRRAATKYHFGGLWANSCCSHPAPGEEPLAAGRRTCERELGISPELREVGAFTYGAHDDRSQLTEREYDHVLTADWDGELHPNSTEVQEIRWVALDALRSEMQREPERFAPWLSHILDGFATVSRPS